MAGFSTKAQQHLGDIVAADANNGAEQDLEAGTTSGASAGSVTSANSGGTSSGSLQHVGTFERKIFGTLPDLGDFEVFSQKWDPNDFQLYLQQTKMSKFRPRLLRIFMFILLPIMLFLFLRFLVTDKLNVNFGIGLLCVFIIYFGRLFAILFGVQIPCCACCFYKRHITKDGGIECERNNAAVAAAVEASHINRENRTLFRIYSVNGFDDYWIEQSFTYRALLFRTHPIESISEFSAIQGNIGGSMLLLLSIFSYMIILCELGAEIHFNKLEVCLADYFELFGMGGLVLIGTFELDPFVQILNIMHYAGAGLGTLTLVGFLTQQIIIDKHDKNGNVIGIVGGVFLGVVACISFGFWQHYTKVSNIFGKKQRFSSKNRDEWRNDKKLRETITWLSYKNIISEAIFLFCGALSMCFWLIRLDECHEYNQCKAW